MESTSIAEQRATAVAKLKRAASLPRMKDGRRPPMHVEAVSEGERGEKDESAQGSEGKPETPNELEVLEQSEKVELVLESHVEENEIEKIGQDIDLVEEKVEEDVTQEDPAERPTTPGRKRRSRSRARSRGSKDLRNKAKTPPPVNNESSADEYGLEDIPPSPPVISPIPSHFAAFQASRLLRSPISPVSPMFYPGTTPSTPMLPSLDEIQKGIGLFRSNSVGAARMMAMQKLTGGSEPLDPTFGSPSPTPLGRNNTVSGGERIAARRNLLRRLGERVKEADTDVTSGGEEVSRPATPATSKRRRRRSRASAVLDDRDEREQPATSPTTPVVPPSPLPPAGYNIPGSPFTLSLEHRRTPVQHIQPFEEIMGGRGVVIEDEDEDGDRQMPVNGNAGLPITPARRLAQRVPHTSDAPSTVSTDSTHAGVPVPVFMSSQPAPYKADAFPASPFATPLREKPFADEDEESDAYRELRLRVPTRNAFERDSEISWVADPGTSKGLMNDTFG